MTDRSVPQTDPESAIRAHSLPQRVALGNEVYVLPGSDGTLMVRKHGQWIRLSGLAEPGTLQRLFEGLLQGSQATRDLVEYAARERPGLVPACARSLRRLLDGGILVPAEMPNANGSPTSHRFLTDYLDSPQQELSKLEAKTVRILNFSRYGSETALALNRMGVRNIQMHDAAFLTPESAASESGTHPEIGREVLSREVPSGEQLYELLSGADLAVVCLETSPFVAVTRAINAACLTLRRRWILATLTSTELLVGPAIVPHETACHACYESRTLMNSQRPKLERDYSQFLSKHPRQTVSAAKLPAMGTVAANLLALEAIKLLTQFVWAPTLGAVLSLDLISLEAGTHKLLRVPHCPACGLP